MSQFKSARTAVEECLACFTHCTETFQDIHSNTPIAAAKSFLRARQCIRLGREFNGFEDYWVVCMSDSALQKPKTNSIYSVEVLDSRWKMYIDYLYDVVNVARKEWYVSILERFNTERSLFYTRLGNALSTAKHMWQSLVTQDGYMDAIVSVLETTQSALAEADAALAFSKPENLSETEGSLDEDAAAVLLSSISALDASLITKSLPTLQGRLEKIKNREFKRMIKDVEADILKYLIAQHDRFFKMIFAQYPHMARSGTGEP
jgi:hypothetical protein